MTNFTVGAIRHLGADFTGQCRINKQKGFEQIDAVQAARWVGHVKRLADQCNLDFDTALIVFLQGISRSNSFKDRQK